MTKQIEYCTALHEMEVIYVQIGLKVSCRG